MKIKKKDQVKMLSGKDNGKTGNVMEVFPVENKVVVEGLNLIKKHTRPKREGEKGQRVELPRKVAVSSVMLICPKCSAAARVGYKIIENGKVRICKKCGKEL